MHLRINICQDTEALADMLPDIRIWSLHQFRKIGAWKEFTNILQNPESLIDWIYSIYLSIYLLITHLSSLESSMRAGNSISLIH